MAEDDEVVQPPEGQGDQSNSSPYAEYLDRLPEEVRGDVEPVFRDWDAQTTRKFQDAAKYRKQWEPLEQTGVSQRDPAKCSGRCNSSTPSRTRLPSRNGSTSTRSRTG